MAHITDLLKAIEESPEGPQICAIFDFDGTVISGFSATVFIREQIRRGDISAREFLELVAAMTSFGMGNLGFSGMMVINAQFMRGLREQTYRDVGEELYQNQIARLVYPESRALVEAHQKKGHTVAIVSSATPYQVEPAASDLGIDHVMCTQLVVEDGEFTGDVVRPTCFGQGKVDAAEDLAAEVDADLSQSFFYSDSYDDIELLEHIGNPVALNPNKKLAARARQKRWPSADFGSRGRPTATEFLRSIAATTSLVSSALAGLPIWALTGSKRDATNFSLSLFADTASALIGLKLNVSGEENLWASRPAIFVFNHQSKADVVILAKLLRRDIAGVGKKEIRNIPVIGKVMEFGGTVMIDRANATNAIEAMAPLVEVVQGEGKSIIISPEGTRSPSPRLGPFKKGAFHMAMQSGVPMVPIVIRNAGDVAPKGDFVFRSATVDVEVLPAVDTSHWKPETIDQHVATVRGMFLEALGQEPDTKAKTPARKKADDSKPEAKKKTKKTTTTPVKRKSTAATKSNSTTKDASTKNIADATEPSDDK